MRRTTCPVPLSVSRTGRCCPAHLANVLKQDVDVPDSMREGVSIRDGFVRFGTEVWWRKEQGPQKVRLDKNSFHHTNAVYHPERYSIAEPTYKVIYED